jgi:hypothetical protein
VIYRHINRIRRPPQVEIVDSDTLPRAQITVSPPRVPHAATTPRVVQPTVTHITTPNSHRRLNPTPRRAVTPSTPYPMIRRSAAQQHLSSDMLPETVQQVSHIFSLPTVPAIKTAKIATKTASVIIMPEMVNAAILPGTGKSLKYQELITILRHKIRGMRPTANKIHRPYKTTTIRFIHKSDVPKGCNVTYGSFVVDIKEHKEER